MHDSLILCIGHLENISSLCYIDLPNVGRVYCIVLRKQWISLIVKLENSHWRSIGKWSNSRWRRQVLLESLNFIVCGKYKQLCFLSERLILFIFKKTFAWYLNLNNYNLFSFFPLGIMFYGKKNKRNNSSVHNSSNCPHAFLWNNSHVVTQWMYFEGARVGDITPFSPHKY